MADAPPVRFGIIGCGGAAVPVAEALAASSVAELAAVYDKLPALAEDLATRLGAGVHHSLESLLADTSLAAVYIAVPHNQLAPLATRALEAGKHVLVEKPMATTLADADALVALADARGLALGVFYELRHAAANVRARAMLQGGAIGRVIGVHCQTLIDKPKIYWQVGTAGRTRSAWRASLAQAGGGVVLMNTSHGLDTIRWLTGLEVVRVAGEIGTLAAEGVEVEDTASASLRFDNGAIGSLFVGAHLAGASEDERITLFGTEGQLRLPHLYGSNPLKVFLRREWGGLAPNEWHVLPDERGPIYNRAVDDFAQAVRDGRPATTSGRDARQVLAIILALYEASASHTFVSLGGS